MFPSGKMGYDTAILIQLEFPFIKKKTHCHKEWINLGSRKIATVSFHLCLSLKLICRYVNYSKKIHFKLLDISICQPCMFRFKWFMSYTKTVKYFSIFSLIM